MGNNNVCLFRQLMAGITAAGEGRRGGRIVIRPIPHRFAVVMPEWLNRVIAMFERKQAAAARTVNGFIITAGLGAGGRPDIDSFRTAFLMPECGDHQACQI